METFTFGSASGTRLAFYFFVSIAVLVGFAVYWLLAHPDVRRERFRSWPAASRDTALTIGVAMALVVILGVYFTSLSGFQRLELHGNELRVFYILPRHNVVFRRDQIAAVRRTKSYQGRWCLNLYTTAGHRLESARADEATVRRAWERLNAFLQPPPGKRPLVIQ